MDVPLSGNPLVSRADLQRAALDMTEAVTRRLSPGRTGARLGATGASFPDKVAELEAFSRPLWGLVPVAAGGGHVDWAPYLRGLANGTDPDHAEFWGLAGDNDQRLVEMAAIGLALALVPEQVWEPLDQRSRDNLARWLSQINNVAVPVNNWLFFQVLVNEGLAGVGAPDVDEVAASAALDRLESYYLGDGWYSDGPGRQRDYYVPFGMHFYGLLYHQQLCTTYSAMALPEVISDRSLQVAVRRLVYSGTRRIDGDRLVDLMTAAEAAFVKRAGLPRNSSKGDKIAAGAAALLADDSELRTTDAQLHRFMLTMYRARNAEIHGDGHLNGNLHRLSGRPTNVLHDALDDAELVMRRAILAAFDEHRPGF